jgi:hypothetical protein
METLTLQNFITEYATNSRSNWQRQKRKMLYSWFKGFFRILCYVRLRQVQFKLLNGERRVFIFSACYKKTIGK